MMRIMPRARKMQAKRSTAPSGLTEATVRIPAIRPRQSRQGSATLTSPILRKAIAKGFGLSSVSPAIRYIGTQAPIVVLPSDVPVETSELAHIQSCLARITESPLVASGRWNQATGEAIALFQQRAGLPVSGALDNGTRETLKRQCVEEGGSVDDGGATSGEEVETEVLEPNLPYTVCDFIDPRIDVEAQYALYEMTREGGAKYKASVEMLSCIKAGTLGGIYQEDQGAPSMKARRAGLGWYGPIISKYGAKVGNPSQQVVCFDDPTGEAPLLVFAKKIRGQRYILKQGLLKAWGDCKILHTARLVHPSGKSCTRPTPPDPIIPAEPGTSPYFCLSKRKLTFIVPPTDVGGNAYIPSQKVYVAECGKGSGVRWQLSRSNSWLRCRPSTGRMLTSYEKNGVTVAYDEVEVSVNFGNERLRDGDFRTGTVNFEPVYEGNRNISPVQLVVEVFVQNDGGSIKPWDGKEYKGEVQSFGWSTASPMQTVRLTIPCRECTIWFQRGLLPPEMKIPFPGGGLPIPNQVPWPASITVKMRGKEYGALLVGNWVEIPYREYDVIGDISISVEAKSGFGISVDGKTNTGSSFGTWGIRCK